MSSRMKWSLVDKRRQATKMAVAGQVIARPVGLDVQSRQRYAQACYHAALQRRRANPAEITIRAKCEQSTRLRRVAVTLPKLKFLEDAE